MQNLGWKPEELLNSGNFEVIDVPVSGGNAAR
jgi:hypothetical protein